MRAGPKAQVLGRSLSEAGLPLAGADRVAAWVEKFVRVPKGTGARGPLVFDEWQRELLRGVFDEPRPRLALWSLPRGQGKSTMSAANGLYGLHADGVEGARVVVVATDERQARIIFGSAVRMTELSEPLAKRTVVYQDRLVVPRTDSTFQVLPAEPSRLEGLDPSLAIIDEIGVVDRRTYEVVALASGKRESSLVVCIGTPSPDPELSPMLDLVQYGRTHPEDRSFFLAEYAAPPDCEIDDEEAWAIANPALDTFLYRDALRALLPPKTRELTFRRTRLGQWVDVLDDGWLPPGAWNTCATGDPIAEGSEVVIALDGSFSQDATGLVAATLDAVPHLDVIGLWEARPGDDQYRVPVADVEQAIRDACRRFRVREIVADPFRWTRTLQALEAERLPVIEFPQSPQRMTPATVGLYEAVVNRAVTHSGDPDLSRHVANATVREDARGTRLAKPRGQARRRIDLAVCAVMAHARATFHARKRSKRRLIVI